VDWRSTRSHRIVRRDPYAVSQSTRELGNCAWRSGRWSVQSVAIGAIARVGFDGRRRVAWRHGQYG